MQLIFSAIFREFGINTLSWVWQLLAVCVSKDISSSSKETQKPGKSIYNLGDFWNHNSFIRNCLKPADVAIKHYNIRCHVRSTFWIWANIIKAASVKIRHVLRKMLFVLKGNGMWGCLSQKGHQSFFLAVCVCACTRTRTQMLMWLLARAQLWCWNNFLCLNFGKYSNTQIRNLYLHGIFQC